MGLFKALLQGCFVAVNKRLECLLLACGKTSQKKNQHLGENSVGELTVPNKNKFSTTNSDVWFLAQLPSGLS